MGAIPQYTFNNCKNLEDVVIGNHVTTIGNNAFWQCDKLQEISIPTSVTTIDNSAFYSCALKTIVIPNSVISIGKSAFSYNSLEDVTIGENTIAIGDGAFYGSDIRKVTCWAETPPVITADCFSGDVYPKAELFVPIQSVNAYQDAIGWRNFSIIRGLNIPSAVGGIEAEDGNNTTTLYDLSGRKLSKKQRGLNILIDGSGKARKVMNR